MSLRFLNYLSAAVFLFCFSLSLSSWGDSDAERAKKLKALKQTMAELQKQLEKTKGAKNSIEKALEKSEKKESDLIKQSEKLEKKLKQEQTNLRNLQSERSSLEKDKKDQSEAIRYALLSAYKQQQSSQIRVLLNQEDPNQLSRNLKHYQLLVQSRSEKISDFETTIASLNHIEPKIEQQKHALTASVNSLKEQQKKLKRAQSERLSTLQELSKKLSSGSAQLEKMNQDSAQLERLLETVSYVLRGSESNAQQQAFPQMKGRLPWPTKGKVIKRYGNKRAASRLKWTGWLISAQEGKSVSAVHYGQVVFADYLRGHGMLVIIDHGNDYYSLYSHNQVLYKELGDWVQAGDTIATVGNSGGLDQHALYFELRHKGKPINPKSWLGKSA